MVKDASTSVVLEETNIDVKVIPYDSELEQNILGSIILEDKLMKNVADTITVNHFYVDLHKKIYSAMLYLHYKNVKIGYETLINRLTFKEKEGYADYIISLGGLIINSRRFESQVELLKDIYQKRVLYKLYKRRITEDISGIASVELVKEIESAIDGMGISNNLELEKFSDYIDDWVVDLGDTTQAVQKYKMGYKLLDDMLLLEDSNLVLIASRPSLGKSALALNLTKNFCKQKKHTLFVSLEMSSKEIMNRLVANMARVPAKKIKRKETLTATEWQNVMHAKEEIKSWNLSTYAKGQMKVEQLEGLAKHLKKKGELDILIVDYLQLLDSHAHNKNRVQQVSFIARKLKQIAMDLDIVVIALSQLNRTSVEGGTTREPQLYDLKESGELEQSANIVIMLHTKDANLEFQDHRYITMFVRKNRDGRLGQINYTYFGDYVDFVETYYDKEKCIFVNSEVEDLTKEKEVDEVMGELPF